VSGSQDKSNQLINGYDRQREIERKAGFTEVGVDRQEADDNEIRSHGQQRVFVLSVSLCSHMCTGI
jgi:recombinational DNA repair ATPase RecF